MRNVTPSVDLSEIVIINGTKHRALVEREKRQIVLRGDVPITPADTVVVSDMTGAVVAVEHHVNYTVIALGGSLQ